MNNTVSEIRLAGYTLAEAERLPIPELLFFIINLPQSLDANEHDLARTIISHLEPMLIYLNKIGLRTLNPTIMQDVIQTVSS